MIKKLGKSKKKLGSLLTMIFMIVTCLTCVSLGDKTHAATTYKIHTNVTLNTLNNATLKTAKVYWSDNPNIPFDSSSPTASYHQIEANVTGKNLSLTATISQEVPYVIVIAVDSNNVQYIASYAPSWDGGKWTSGGGIQCAAVGDDINIGYQPQDYLPNVIQLENLLITGMANDGYEYTGNPISVTPNIYLRDGTPFNRTGSNVKLVENRDYNVLISNNINAGDATLKIEFKSPYKGTISKVFKITPKKIATENIDASLDKSEYDLNGPNINPIATVKVGGKTLTKSVDYDIIFPNLVTIGNYSAQVTLKGNYSGTKTVNYKIIQKNVVILEANKYPSSVTVSNFPDNINSNENLIFNVNANTGWSIVKDDISIEVAGKKLTSDQYTYDARIGQVSVNGDKVNGAIKVSVAPSLNWYTTNSKSLNDSLEKTSVTKADFNTLNTLNTGWAGLTTDAKNYIVAQTGQTVAEITTKLNAMKTASQFINDNDSKIQTIKEITTLDPNTNDNIRNTIKELQKGYNDLGTTSQKYISDLNTKLTDLTKTQGFCDKYKDVFNSQYITKDAVNSLKDFENDYKALNDEQKKLAKDTYNKLNDKLEAANMLNAHTAVIDNTSIIGIKDDADNVFKSITNAITAYDNLNDKKKVINPAVREDLVNKLTAASWVQDHTKDNGILSKKTVGANDLNRIQATLDELNGLDENTSKHIDSDIKTTLENQKDAATWLQNSIVNKVHVDYSDIANLQKAIKEYNDLGTDKQSFINSNIKSVLDNKLKAAQWSEKHKSINENKEPMQSTDYVAVKVALDEYEANKNKIGNYVDPIIIKNLQDKLKVTETLKNNPILEKNIKDIIHADFPKLKAGIDAYEQLTANQKALVSQSTKDLVVATKSVNKWMTDSKAILDKNIVSKDDLNDINKALDDYAKLDDNAKKLVDASYVQGLKEKKNAAEWNETNNEVISKDMKNITAGDLVDLRKAMDAYNQLTDGNKSHIDGAIISKLKEAQKKAFVEKYISDKEGNVNDKLTSDNYEQILSGQTDWANMSQDEKDEINAVVTEKLGCTYEELIANATTLKEAANSFIDDYLTDKKGNVYKDSNSSNYGQILSGLDAWNKMSQDEKGAVNGILASQGGKTYEELMTNAKVLKDSTDGFINQYLTEKDGNIYKDSNSSNYGQILSGLDVWDKMSQNEKDAVNAILTVNGGKTYEELIDNAKTLKDSTDGYVNKYLTGKDGKIYKEANKSNYAQILSGKDAWNKLSQSEKDAINGILKANGGKTYEELLKQANDVKASVKTSDNTDIMSLCTLLSSSLLLGGYVVLKRRKEA
ncbi:hypothetical protein [Candidatus Stoquefichus massiliensis]|uniref:hypothetical protein n=1 Tax=Candidatus Stoquefichus massiliensis TaxID=1470350 RepID=UPI0005CAF143|nr:hypothetical protein [Candidatus Stoquefichus massiliensis]